MRFDFEKNLQDRLRNPEYNTEININQVLKNVIYPSTPPSLKDLKKYIHTTSSKNVLMDTVLSQSQMLEDFEQFKFLIQNVYSGYKVLGEFFFENAFKKMFLFICSHKTATIEEFANQLNLSLEGLNDAHFSIHPQHNISHRPLEIQGKRKTYLNSKFDIKKINNKYYLNGKKVIAINNSPKIENYIKKICGVDGKIKFGLVSRTIQKSAAENIKISISLEDGEELSVLLSRKKMDTLFHHDNGFLEKFENIIYFRNTECNVFDRQKEKQLQEFTKIIKENIDEVDFVIVDSRKNRGGADIFVSNINKAILGMNHFKHRVGLFHLCAKKNYQKEIKNDQEYAENIYKAYQESIKNGTPNIKEIKVQKQENSPHNNKIVFILTDERSMSAGEEYNNELATFANVVFVNDNTAGMKNFGNVSNYFLNHSKIRLKLANSYVIHGKNIIENKGFPPDIYFDCEADEILLTLENFINYNTGLKCPSLLHLQKYNHQPHDKYF